MRISAFDFARRPRAIVSIAATSCLLLSPINALALSYGVCAWTYPSFVCGSDAGAYQPLKDKGLLSIAASSSDYDSGLFTASADASVYGSDSSWDAKVWLMTDGLGIEPMAYAVAETVVLPAYTGSPPAIAFATGDITILHRIRAIGTAPEEAALAIPMFLHYRLAASDGTGTSTVANFGIDAVHFDYSLSVRNGESRSGTLSFNSSVFDAITIGASAGAAAGYEATPEGVVGKSAHAVADPFLFIDPLWAYAGDFVVEEESLRNPGEWVAVTRMWQSPQNAAPEPGTAALLGLGLAALAAVGRRKR